jgi:proline iminopeptidase
MQIRDVTLPVDVVGHGPPVLLMHGGPGADRFTLWPLRQLRDQFTIILYDHRCNGRARGAPVASMTWDNLTADADALRERLGFERWAVLGHSFGGHVALEYALRYPDRLTHLALVDTAATSSWSQEQAPELLAARGWSPADVSLARRWFNGQVQPKETFRSLMRLGPAYYDHPSMLALLREALRGSWRTKLRPEALIFAGQHLMKGWWVVHRLPEIDVPTLVIAGASDFIFPPEAQAQLVAGIRNAELHLIANAGHEPWSERPDAFFPIVRRFLSAPSPATSGAGERRPGRSPDPRARLA